MSYNQVYLKGESLKAVQRISKSLESIARSLETIAHPTYILQAKNELTPEEKIKLDKHLADVMENPSTI